MTVEHARHEARAIAARLKQQHGDKTWMADAAVVSLGAGRRAVFKEIR